MSSESYGKDRDIVGTLQDNRTIAKGSTTEIVQWVKDSVPPYFVQVNLPNLRSLETILDINVKVISPKACIYGICDKTVTRHPQLGYPIVGFTVVGMTYIASGLTAAGVTVTTEVVAIGV